MSIAPGAPPPGAARPPEYIGGPYGQGARVIAEVAAMRAFADLCTHLAQEALAAGARARQALLRAQPALLATGGLAPWTAAAVEADLLRALFGPRDALVEALALAAAVRAAAAAYEQVDDVVRLGWEVVDGLAAPALAAHLAGVAGRGKGRGQTWQDAAGSALGSSPVVLEHAVNGGWTVLAPLTSLGLATRWLDRAPGKPVNPPPGPLETAALGLAVLYTARPATVGPPVQLAARPAPTTLADLYRTLDPTPDRDGPGARVPPGRVDVIRRDWVDAGGAPRASVVVALPGTSSWEMPWSDEDADVRDLHANARLLAGRSTAEVDALPEVLALAGVPAGAAVALVGHSQGGMTAVRAARHPRLTSAYRVSHVLTAGSPVATMAPPARARVLSLEDRRDPVPALDGERNPDRPGHLTVRFDGTAAPGPARHAMRGYIAGARHVDEAVAAWRDAHPAGSTAGPPHPDRHGARGPETGGVRGAADFEAGLRAGGFLAAAHSGEQVTVTRVELTSPAARPTDSGGRAKAVEGGAASRSAPAVATPRR